MESAGAGTWRDCCLLLPCMHLKAVGHCNTPSMSADGIAQAMLQLSHGAAATLASQPAWLQAALDPRRRVLFLDTSAVEGARESGGCRAVGGGVRGAEGVGTGGQRGEGASTAIPRSLLLCSWSCSLPVPSPLHPGPSLTPCLAFNPCSGRRRCVQPRRGPPGAAHAVGGGVGGRAALGAGRHFSLPFTGGLPTATE